MPPHDGAGRVVDWPAVERAWGVVFPSDYREFVSVYGAGTVGNAEIEGDMDEETEAAREEWEDGFATHPEGMDPKSGGLVAWGVDAAGDVLCWFTAGADPDSWPVLLYSRRTDRWTLYRCGMATFLCKLFQAELYLYPLSFPEHVREAAPRFLTRAEERRIRDSGTNAWSGAAL
ncbi:SMI1/KNR4 family protein [Streptomyces sp. NPDC002896]|uniref:SMI1/KNR4 family protein n=1 Tax=Streptomyces sp. NPDC002896 TaxID=3154438 RepID=UPI003318D173